LQNVQTPPVILSVGEGNRALYTAGSVCAIIGPDGAPAYYYGQTDVVTAASLHPGDAKFKPGSVVATAQGGRKPHICIWEIESMTTICTLRDFHEKSILAVSFAPSGEYLSTISGDTQHTLYVFLWQSKELLVTAKVSTEQFSSMQYHPYDARMLITLCSHNLKIWEMQFTGKGQSMKIAPRTGLLPATPGKNNRCAGFKSMAFLDNKVTLVGSLEGSLYLWRGTDLSTIIEGVHPGGVTAATDVPHTDVVLTSGYDGNIHVWRRSALLSDGGAAFTPIRTVHVKEFFESVKPYSLSALLSFSVSAATESGINLFAISNGNFVVQIVLGADAATSSGSCKVLTTSHGRCQTAPLIVAHPSTNKMYAVSQSQLQVLDIADGKLSRSVPLSTPVTVMAIHPNGTTLAMARAPKSISFYDTASLVETSTISDSFPDASLLKFSPSGQYLAVASAKESIVEVYDIPNSYKRLGRTKHSGPVQHLDWSMDSEFFQTDDVSKQHLYFRKDCTRVADSRMCADLIFTPWTCKYGWPVQGIWEDPAQPEDITSVRTTRDNRLCFVGDSKGNIKVFLYPSASKLASHRLYRGHGPNVSNILLNFDESTLITTSSDGCIFQWGVAPLEQ
jgi:WD40 repeat protein